MATTLEYMKFALNVYASSLVNQIGVPLGWTRTNWQPDLASGFSAGCCTLFNKVKTAALLLCCGLLITACGASSEKWREEVQLSNGQIIVVERETVRERGGDEWAANRSGTKPKQYRIRFEHPAKSGNMVTFETQKSEEGGWPEVPLAFDILDDKPTVFTSLPVSLTCHVYSKYVYQNNLWEEKILTEHFELHPTNLLFGSKKDMPEILTLQDKLKRNSASGYHKSHRQVGPNFKVCDNS